MAILTFGIISVFCSAPPCGDGIPIFAGIQVKVTKHYTHDINQLLNNTGIFTT